VDSFDYGVVISGHSGSYGNETNRFLRSLRSVEMTKAPRPRGPGGKILRKENPLRCRGLKMDSASVRGMDMRQEYHPGFSGHFRLRG